MKREINSLPIEVRTHVKLFMTEATQLAILELVVEKTILNQTSHVVGQPHNTAEFATRSAIFSGYFRAMAVRRVEGTIGHHCCHLYASPQERRAPCVAATLDTTFDWRGTGDGNKSMNNTQYTLLAFPRPAVSPPRSRKPHATQRERTKERDGSRWRWRRQWDATECGCGGWRRRMGQGAMTMVGA